MFFKKKVVHITFLFCLLCACVRSQSLVSLDRKRSFKDFKIGDAYQKWESNLVLTKDDGSYKQYLYKGDCCKTIFDIPVENIGLIFKNGKLLFILIDVDKNQTKDFKKSAEEYDFINQSFETLFSKSTSYKNDVNSGITLCSWQTQKTILATKYAPLDNSEGYEIKVFIADRSYFTGKISSGF